MNATDRVKIDNLKNGVKQKKRFDKYKDAISKCSEIELFIQIDQLGYMIWRTEHDLADGRIEYPEWDKNDKYVLQAEIELAVAQTARFGVQPFEANFKPTPLYYKWYAWWNSYIKDMPEVEWNKVSADLRNKDVDYSKYRPEGDWK